MAIYIITEIPVRNPVEYQLGEPIDCFVVDVLNESTPQGAIAHATLVHGNPNDGCRYIAARLDD
jgi:hypothetical protein